MKTFVLAILVLFFAGRSIAQRDNASLLVQSPDGKTVKLVWFFKSWSNDITGFDIKRKDGLQDWVKLNKEPILPEISGKKDLSIVETDRAEEGRVRARLYKLLSAGTMTAIDNETYLKKLNSDEKAVVDLSNSIAADYDIALISGFGYVDRTIVKKTNYEYGLFIKDTNILLDSVLWNYGQIPDLNVITEITSKATTGAGGIVLTWTADLNKMRGGYVAGFNIYREGIRLNQAPILFESNKDPSEFKWNDKSANTGTPSQYSISAESLFGIEGIIKSYTYNPGDHPKEYVKAEVTDIASLGYYFRDGIEVKWDFPKEYKKFIRGFYIEKDNMPAGYTLVSPLLDTSANTFIDKTISSATVYIRFRVNALYNDKTIATGKERVYSYFPIREAPIPQNFKDKAKFGEKKIVINFTWDHMMSGDSVTNYYKIYASDTLDGSFHLITSQPIRGNQFTYTVDHGTAAMHRFYLSSVSRNNTESQPGDTLTVQFPSLELPVPTISNLFIDNDGAVVDWKYPDISDLKGFRLYQNKNIIANETVLNKNFRQFKTQILKSGSNYDFTLQAVSGRGILSTVSPPVSIAIPKNRKR